MAPKKGNQKGPVNSVVGKDFTSKRQSNFAIVKTWIICILAMVIIGAILTNLGKIVIPGDTTGVIGAVPILLIVVAVIGRILSPRH